MNGLTKACSLILLFLMNFAFSQNKIETYKDSVKTLLYTNPTKAKYYSHKLLKYSKSNDLEEDEARAYCFLADLSGALTQKDSAFYYFDKAIYKANDIDNEKLEMVFKINKANYLFNEFDFQEALNLYEECSTLSKKLKDNNAYNYISIKKGSIAYELERYQDALKIYKENLNKKGFDDVSKLDIKLGLVKTYINLNKQDSAHIFIKSGIEESQKSNLKEHEIHFLSQQGLIYIDNKDYSNAKITFDKALLIAQKIQSNTLITEINIKISKLYSIQKEYNKAISLLKSIVADEKASNIPIENLSEIYYLLAENYKSIENFSESNYYYSQFIDKSKKIGEKRIEAIDHLHKIDINESKERETEQKNQKWILLGLTSLLILLFIGFFIRRRRESIQNQVKFEELLLKIKDFENQPVKNSEENLQNNVLISKNESIEEDIDNHQAEEFETELVANSIITIDQDVNEEVFQDNSNEGEETTNPHFIIKDETRTEILDKLIKLEEKKLFLRQDFTLHNVAKRLKTNTAYLSKIVNSELDKNFSSYVNELRINYIIIELKNNSKLRSYSINAIGEEIGYKSPESFTKYFKIATGISPSIYIKKINQMKES
ncbi:helix-turn-helix domain-containing protein [Flavobacterium sp. GA093]|uniref:Helix-turn-helix domain-containing protein n=1 Tax=Flavobacterium hydrocarbonoxydans TaxID=2683249 RepID=A0A6I4P063_9FLAO|nr:helix-turn-helix domain-containing protein [Flavobacterium hydrocarbonoxydans]MWB96554.1 helix-turn-helix domain-containing protein [Flavobacterium hydrocarbonoxydans]